MKYSFGTSSSKKLNSSHHRLNQLARRVLSYGVMDFSVIEGHRTLNRQLMLFNNGYSRIDGVIKKGKHNYSPSLAIDVLPFPQTVNEVDVWSDKQRFCVLAGLFYAAAAELGLSIRWGGDWDGDGNNADSSLHDMPHIELVDYE